MQKRRPRWWLRIAGATLLALVALAAWAVLIEPGRLVVREEAIGLYDWPAARNGYRIAFITDLHVGSPHVGLAALDRIVETVNGQKPDLILLGGDFVVDGVFGGEKIDITAIAPVLARLHAKDGVFAVLGNHDNWNDGPRIAGELTAHGIPVLADAAVHVGGADDGFWLVGISDATTAPHDIDKALTGVTGSAIALTHSPDVFPAIPENISLTLAGHTHGGQVYVPFFGRPIVPSRFGQRYAIGIVHEGARTLFVSSGVGTSIIPVRFLTPPEIAVLTLTRD